MLLQIPYTPHAKQREIHEDSTRFKVVAAGRRGGKSVLAVNELLKRALGGVSGRGRNIPRYWYVSPTFKQSEAIAWKTFLNFCPPELIANKRRNKLDIELTNEVLVEFKGATDDPANLKGVGVEFIVLDEYGNMREEVWHDIFRPMLMDSGGGALFIGTPEPDGSPHFQDLWNQGQTGMPDWKSWLFFTSDNPAISKDEIEKARLEYPDDIFKREFEADFTITAGLIYDNFRHQTHVVPHYEPNETDLVIGSIDPGLHNPTAALLTAWNRDNEAIVFKEYYVENKLAGENAKAILELEKGYKVAYWVIDRSSTRRDPASGITVFSKFQEFLKPLLTAANDPGTVWAGIDEVKKLFHVDPLSGRPRLRIAHQCHNTLWELGKYVRHKHTWLVSRNNEEKPRKMHDHAMDALRNMVMTQPWKRRNLRVYDGPAFLGY